MTIHRSDKIFSGSIPEFYDTYLVPLIFEPYAQEMAQRVSRQPVARVLEIASGSGVVTRAMVDALGADISIIATDLNQPMLDYAASVRTDDAHVNWRQADALSLPFADDSFDVVVCQFAVMFFPDRAKAYSEALRVLARGGRFLFNVWDQIGENEFADTVTQSLVDVFPSDPPRFLERTPHGYSSINRIAEDLEKGGFSSSPEFETVTARSRASSPSIPAIAYCQGTPLRNEIESREASLLEHATGVATEAIANRFGERDVDGKIQAHVVSIQA